MHLTIEPKTVWQKLTELQGETDESIIIVGDCKTPFSKMDRSSRQKISKDIVNLKNNHQLGIPGGAVVENLPANAGDMGSSPGLGRSHMPRSNWAREPQLLSLRVWSLCSATREATIVRGPHTGMKGGPRSPQLKKALTHKRRPNTAKDK